jgi:hypothetical protein
VKEVGVLIRSPPVTLEKQDDDEVKEGGRRRHSALEHRRC